MFRELQKKFSPIMTRKIMKVLKANLKGLWSIKSQIRHLCWRPEWLGRDGDITLQWGEMAQERLTFWGDERDHSLPPRKIQAKLNLGSCLRICDETGRRAANILRQVMGFAYYRWTHSLVRTETGLYPQLWTKRVKEHDSLAENKAFRNNYYITVAKCDSLWITS